MTYETIDNGYIVRLKRGEELVENLIAFANETKLPSAWLSGLGAARHSKLGYFNAEHRDYMWKDFPELHEVLSLQGNLAWSDGKPFWHIHAVLGTAEYTTIGGHVKEMETGVTMELLVQNTQQKLERAYDDDTGAKLLTL